jgi:hypothetical protein
MEPSMNKTMGTIVAVRVCVVAALPAHARSITVANADDSCDIGAYEYPHGIHPPRADAGQDKQIERTSDEGAHTILDGCGSTDFDSTPGTNDDIVLFEWFEDLEQPSEVVLGYGEVAEPMLPIGTHVITPRVTDSHGATDTDDVVKTIVAAPPEITCPGDRVEECQSAGHRRLLLRSAADVRSKVSALNCTPSSSVKEDAQ